MAGVRGGYAYHAGVTNDYRGQGYRYPSFAHIHHHFLGGAAGHLYQTHMACWPIGKCGAVARPFIVIRSLWPLIRYSRCSGCRRRYLCIDLLRSVCISISGERVTPVIIGLVAPFGIPACS
jgi:hypothetical protein